ncbi:unnamed protein product, partial [Gulo gulo]
SQDSPHNLHAPNRVSLLLQRRGCPISSQQLCAWGLLCHLHKGMVLRAALPEDMEGHQPHLCLWKHGSHSSLAKGNWPESSRTTQNWRFADELLTIWQPPSQQL